MERSSLSHVALHTGHNFWKEYILRFLKTPPFKNLKWSSMVFILVCLFTLQNISILSMFILHILHYGCAIHSSHHKHQLCLPCVVPVWIWSSIGCLCPANSGKTKKRKWQVVKNYHLYLFLLQSHWQMNINWHNCLLNDHLFNLLRKNFDDRIFHISDSNPSSGVELNSWTFQWDLTL